MNQYAFLQSEPRGPSQLVETDIVVNGQGRTPFDDNEQLKSKIDQRIVIKGMQLVTTDVLSNSVTSGNPTAPLAELQKMTFVFYCEGWEKAQYVPALFFNTMATPAGTMPYQQNRITFDNWVNLDWAKSYIQFSNTTSSANAPYCVMLDVLYEKYDAQGKFIKGPS